MSVIRILVTFHSKPNKMKTLNIFLLFIFLASCSSNPTQAEDIKKIRQLLDTQAEAWSKNDIEGFMQTYWKSEDLKFYGASGITRGWDQTLANYKKRYPTKAETGTLNFTIDDITQISNDAYWVMGQYHLTRQVGDAKGTFLIILKRIDGEWKIVGDSSC